MSAADGILKFSEFFSGQRLGYDRYRAVMAELGNPTVVMTLIPGRCGSTYFARMIERTGLCGSGNEIFNERTAAHWAQFGRDIADNLRDMAQAEIRGNILWFQITPGRLRDLATVIDQEVLRSWKVHAILRRDVAAQAISYIFATVTGIWHSTDGVAGADRTVPFDLALPRAQHRVRALLNDEEEIRTYISDLGSEKILVQYYEDIASESSNEVIRFFRYLGLAYDPAIPANLDFHVTSRLVHQGAIELYDAMLRADEGLVEILDARKTGPYGVRSSPETQGATIYARLVTKLLANDPDASESNVKDRIVTALDLARNGKCTEALNLLPASPDDVPRDVTTLHHAGVVLRLCGQTRRALTFFDEALRVTPGFHYTQMEIAEALADLGDLEQSLVWYQKARESAPQRILAYVCAARLERQLGRNNRGVALLERAHAMEPSDRELTLTYIDALIYQGCREDAVAAYEALIKSGSSTEKDRVDLLMLLSELGQYERLLMENLRLERDPADERSALRGSIIANAKLALNYDFRANCAAADELQAGPRWLGVATIAESIRAAIAARAPMSMIRLGDGEARFLIATDPTLRGVLSPAEMLETGESIWGNWFGTHLADEDPAMIGQFEAKLLHAISDADIVGTTDSARLQRDGRHRGYLLYLNQLIGTYLHENPRLRATNALIHIDLHRKSPFYANLLEGLDFLGVISPHRGLAQRLASLHGIGDVAEYVVPGEMRLPERSGHARGSGHFPVRYGEILHELQVPREGAVFLVAAGLLGKVYCSHIKDRGGIAIDVGSIVDAWMGFNTRPGQFNDISSWRLP